MALQITPNPRSSGNLSISANQRARMSSVVSLSWSKITGAPDFAGEIADLNTGLAALDADLDAQIAGVETEITALEAANNFTQAGTGAVTYPVISKIGQVFSAKDFNCKGDGTTPDAANLKKAIAAVIALGKGELWIPAGEYNCDGTTIIADLSAISTRFQGRIVIRGDGAATIIRNTTSAAACFKFLGNTANSESYFELRNIRFKGAASAAAAVTGSKGLEIDVAAFFQVRGVTAEGFEYGHDCTDVEQFEFSNNEWRFNKNGGVFRGVGSVTDTNSALITNNQYSNNSLTGLTVNHANAFKMVGGSIQYNGLVGGASNTGGLFLQEAGTGYGTVNFDSVAFEGNGGMGDGLITQTTNPAIIAFQSCGFARTQTFGPTVGYGTNNINVSGTNANTTIILTGNTFRFFGGYTESASRPTIALNNTSCKIYDDGTNYFQSTTEKLTYPVAQTIVREKLTANRTYYVRTGGSNSNNGLTNSSSGAFLTPQYAIDLIMRGIDLSGFSVTIDLTGSFTSGIQAAGTFVGAGATSSLGSGSVIIKSTAGASITTTSADAISASQGCILNIVGANLTLSTVTGGNALSAYGGGTIIFGGLTFGAAAGGHIQAGWILSPAGLLAGPGTVYITSSYTITGGAIFHWHVPTDGSVIDIFPGITITLTGTPAFSGFFAGVTKGLIFANAASPPVFSGSATGQQYAIHNSGAMIGLNNGSSGLPTLPGNIAGTIFSGGNVTGQTDTDSFMGIGTLNVANNVNATGFVGGTAANAVATFASTSSGAPSGDIAKIVGSTVQLNGVNIAPIVVALPTYASTFSATTGTATVTAKKLAIGKLTFVNIDVTYTSAITGQPTVTLPTNSLNAGVMPVVGINTGTPAIGDFNGSSNVVNIIGLPLTNGTRVIITGFYESV